MTKQLAMAFGLGAILPLVGAVYCGGENLAQAGLRLAAIEQGFALASTHWQFQATPAQQLELARWDEPQPAPAAAKKPKAAAPAKRR